MVVYDIGSIADWLVAIGTIGTVIVALYLANRERRPRARVTSKFSYMIDSINGVSNEPIHVSAQIVNIGLIPIHLSECTIKVGKEKMTFLDGSHNVNKLIGSGEFYEHVLSYQHIKKYYLQKGMNNIKTYIFFKDASGKIYKSKVRFNL